MSTLSIGLLNQLGDALEAAGYTPKDITKLRSSGKLGEIKNVLKGNAEITLVTHTIDGDADPFMLSGWTVEAHQKTGAMKIERRGDDLYINDKKIELYLSKRQVGNKTIVGHKLREEVSKKEILNANVLDYLLAHLELIPKHWKKDENGNIRYIFFWGTIYRHSDGSLYVRFLYWFGVRWRWDCRWLDRDWRSSYPALVCAE